MIPALLVTLLACVLSGVATPVVRYDQRQDGETNIDGKLENLAFVVLMDDSELTELAVEAAALYVPSLIRKNLVAAAKMALPAEVSSPETTKQTTTTEATTTTQLNHSESGSTKQ